MTRHHVAWRSSLTGVVIVGVASWDTAAAAQANADYCIQRFAVLAAPDQTGPTHWVVAVDEPAAATAEKDGGK